MFKVSFTFIGSLGYVFNTRSEGWSISLENICCLVVSDITENAAPVSTSMSSLYLFSQSEMIVSLDDCLWSLNLHCCCLLHWMQRQIAVFYPVCITFYPSFTEYLSVSVALVSWIGRLGRCVPNFCILDN